LQGRGAIYAQVPTEWLRRVPKAGAAAQQHAAEREQNHSGAGGPASSTRTHASDAFHNARGDA
jgi:hypothetical protein